MCPSGSYGITEGATVLGAACEKCPPGSVSASGAAHCGGCAAGSIRAPSMLSCTPCVERGQCNIAAAFQFVPILPSPVPVTLADQSTSDTTPLWTYYVVTTVALLTIVAFTCNRRIPAHLARTVDIFPVDHWIPDGGPVVKQTTSPGAACSIAFAAAAVCAVSVLVVQFENNNIVSTQSLVPAVLVGSTPPIAVPYIELEIIFVDGDQSACNQRGGNLTTVESPSGIQYSSNTLHWSFDSSGGCKYTYRLNSVRLGVTSSVSVSEPAWLMQHVMWSVRATSGVPNMLESTINGSLDASAQHRVVGLEAIAVAATAAQVLDTTGTTILRGAMLALGGSSTAQNYPYDDGSRVKASDTVTLQFNFQVRRAL